MVYTILIILLCSHIYYVALKFSDDVCARIDGGAIFVIYRGAFDFALLLNTISRRFFFFLYIKRSVREGLRKEGVFACELERKPSISGRIFDYTRQTSPCIYIYYRSPPAVLIDYANNMPFDFFIAIIRQRIARFICCRLFPLLLFIALEFKRSFVAV